jgi:hypothetical protein
MTVTPSNLWSVLQGFNVMACLTLLNLIIDTVNEGYPLGAVLNLHVECSAIGGQGSGKSSFNQFSLPSTLADTKRTRKKQYIKVSVGTSEQTYNI